MDEERVCCLCGDVGFPDKLFHCSRCRFRFQHSYCSNYYSGSMESSSSSSSSISTCDWCQSEVGSRNGSNSNNNNNNNNNNRMKVSTSSTMVGREIKVGSNNKNNNTGGAPSPRTNSHRRYKLLKDVMC